MTRGAARSIDDELCVGDIHRATVRASINAPAVALFWAWKRTVTRSLPRVRSLPASTASIVRRSVCALDQALFGAPREGDAR